MKTNLLRALIAATLLAACLSHPASAASPLTVEQKSVSAGGRTYRATVVRVPLASCRVKVGLANGRVGATAPLDAIARASGAVAAINGCFFSAYTKDAIKPPYHHLLMGGQLVHHGNVGTTLGIDAEGRYRMESLRIGIRGTVEAEGGRSQSWYAYRVNYPLESSSAAILYTLKWVGGKTPAGGAQVVVADGVVKAVGAGPQAIPANGYVLLFAGGDQGLASRFHVGDRCRYQLQFESPDAAFWQGAQEGIACGPHLVQEGRVCYDPTGEGFSSPKILSISGQRSAVGLTRDGTLLLVTCGATVRQLADVMRALGAWDAMNLDGGASSGLWAQGKYLTRPGRLISNALVVVPK